MEISLEQFTQIAGRAFDDLPSTTKEKLYNVALVVEDLPTREQMESLGGKNQYSLFGLYEGYVQSSRMHAGPVLPDKITLFRLPIMRSCDDINALKQRVLATLKHEIAHHFGSDEKGARQATNK